MGIERGGVKERLVRGRKRAVGLMKKGINRGGVQTTW